MAFTGSTTYKDGTVLTSVVDDRTVPDSLALERKTTWTDGTGANQAQTRFHDERTLASSGVDNLDFNDASNALKDVFGVALQLTAIKSLVIHNKSGNGAAMSVGPPGANGWITAMAASDVMAIRDGGLFVIEDPTAAGYVVTAGSGDLFTITNLDGSVSLTYSITIIGLI